MNLTPVRLNWKLLYWCFWKKRGRPFSECFLWLLFVLWFCLCFDMHFAIYLWIHLLALFLIHFSAHTIFYFGWFTFYRYFNDFLLFFLYDSILTCFLNDFSYEGRESGILIIMILSIYKFLVKFIYIKFTWLDNKLNLKNFETSNKLIFQLHFHSQPLITNTSIEMPSVPLSDVVIIQSTYLAYLSCLSTSLIIISWFKCTFCYQNHRDGFWF